MSVLKKKIVSIIKYLKVNSRELRKIQHKERFIPGKTTKLFNSPAYFTDSLSFIWQYDDIFTQEIYKFKSKSTRPLIIDCGANIGLSLIYFKILYPESRIVAFEPNPDILDVCRKNIESFKLQNITLHNFALWNDEKTLLLQCDKADGSYISKNKSSDTIEVKSVKLSDYIDETTELLKIDIEGAEYFVLSESKSKLNLVNNIFIEYHSRVNEEQRLHNILKILHDHGFRYYLKSTGIHNHSPFINRDTYNGYDNFLNIFAFRT